MIHQKELYIIIFTKGIHPESLDELKLKEIKLKISMNINSEDIKVALNSKKIIGELKIRGIIF